ncbi:MAG: HU family DNA-binding protein [Desulfobacteraceae bacterium]|nr:HU family DNA-binding protein [Desulfobacteraceae bacterium]
MNSSEVIKRLSSRLGLSQRETRRLLKHSTEILQKTLDRDLSFSIPGLGTFGTHLQSERKAYNPYHKTFMMLPPKRVVYFHPSSVLKNHVKARRTDNE